VREVGADLLLRPDASLRDAMDLLLTNGEQIVLVTDARQRLLGTVTDGDIRRHILDRRPLEDPVSAAMNASPTTVPVGTQSPEVWRLMARDRLRHLPVIDDEGHVQGLITLADFLPPIGRPNWAVVMAGGRGRRLGQLTDETPKPLIPVGGRPILDTIVSGFGAQGFERLFISVNYKKSLIQEHFAKTPSAGLRIEYLEERAPLGTAGSLALLPERPDHPFVVMNADVLTSLQFDQVLAYHEEHKAVATMCVREVEQAVPFGVTELDGPRVKDLVEKPVRRYQANAGIYVLSPQVLDLIPDPVPLPMTDLLRQLIDKGEQVVGYPLDDYWVDIGQLTHLHQAREEFDSVFHLVP